MKNEYLLNDGPKRREDEDGLFWDTPNNPYNGSEDEEGGDYWESYNEGWNKDPLEGENDNNEDDENS